MSQYTFSHFTHDKFYSFYRHASAPKASGTTHTGYSLFINISPSTIEMHQNDLKAIFHEADIPFYLMVNHPTGYPGKNLIAFLGIELNHQETQDLCVKIETLLKEKKASPESLPEGSSEKRRTIPGSLYLSYSSDYNKNKPHTSCPRLFSHSDLHPALENALGKKPNSLTGKSPEIIRKALAQGRHPTSYRGKA